MRRLSRNVSRSFVVAAAIFATGCAQNAATTNVHDHDTMVTPVATPVSSAVPGDSSIAPGATTAAARLASSPRHGEWVTIRTVPQAGDSLRLWVVYPQRSTKAPVVIVVHEIFGLSTWIRSVADQLAADGFIAIAPDFLTGKVAVAPQIG